MTIEAKTLEGITHALQQQGMLLLTDVTFIRAPYRHDHHWTCTVEVAVRH